MLIYEATKEEFMIHALEDTIVERISNAYRANGLSVGTKSEIRSWQNSLQYMYKVLSCDSIPNNSGVAIEFKIPLTSKRIDFMISGYDRRSKGNVIIIELKQWGGKDTRRIIGKDGLVETFLGGSIRETTHPSYQAWSYFTFISDFNESVQDGNIFLHPCAYLHNFEQAFRVELDNETYTQYVSIAPLYLKGDALKLREFINQHIAVGDNKKNLYELNSGKIRPSKFLQDSLCNMLCGNKEFVMIDSQKVVFENALFLASKSNKDDKKRVMIVEGGPGTGKSVLAINILVRLIGEGIVTQYVSKNSAPRNVYAAKLKGQKKAQEINHLFRGSGSYTETKTNAFGALLVDEAHRLNEKSGLFRNKGKNQIKEIINASKFSLFFIDENQKVDIFDIGSKGEIKKYAKQARAEIITYELDSQFRCNGSDGYLAWLDDVLGIRETANADGFDFNYEIKIFDNPVELRAAITKKNELNNKSRLVAGYCWNWLREGKTISAVHDICIGDDFKMSWNLGNSSTWAIDVDSVNEVGCIHTCQGLEFDYVGVIIGNDLRFENDEVVTDYTKRASTDNSLKGIKKLAKEDPEKANKLADTIIRNTYRTLMSRGQKGCYIYCTDKKLSEYLKKRISVIESVVG